MYLDLAPALGLASVQAMARPRLGPWPWLGLSILLVDRELLLDRPRLYDSSVHNGPMGQIGCYPWLRVWTGYGPSRGSSRDEVHNQNDPDRRSRRLRRSGSASRGGAGMSVPATGAGGRSRHHEYGGRVLTGGGVPGEGTPIPILLACRLVGQVWVLASSRLRLDSTSTI